MVWKIPESIKNIVVAIWKNKVDFAIGTPACLKIFKLL